MRRNERRDSGQDDLSRPWLDQLVDMDPALAKFGPAAVADRGLERLNWADSAPTGAASVRTGVRAKAVIARPRRCELGDDGGRAEVTFLGPDVVGNAVVTENRAVNSARADKTGVAYCFTDVLTTWQTGDHSRSSGFVGEVPVAKTIQACPALETDLGRESRNIHPAPPLASQVQRLLPILTTFLVAPKLVAAARNVDASGGNVATTDWSTHGSIARTSWVEQVGLRRLPFLEGASTAKLRSAPASNTTNLLPKTLASFSCPSLLPPNNFSFPQQEPTYH